jgi:hypothetical protein
MPWLAGDGPNVAAKATAVCEGFLCPSLGTADDYQDGCKPPGCASSDSRPDAACAVHLGDLQDARSRSGCGLTASGGLGHDPLVEHFDTLLDAYRTGAMRYGLFVARKD